MKKKFTLVFLFVFLFITNSQKGLALSNIYLENNAIIATCSTPNNFSVVVDYDNYELPAFVLSWDSVAHAQLYNIYLYGELVAIVINDTSLVIFGATGIDYCFSITAICEDNSESEFSEVICEKIIEPTTCLSTDFLVVALNNTQINIAWAEVSNAVGYNIYRNDALLTFVQTNSYVDTNIQSGHLYCYSIQTVCFNDVSELSYEECENVEIIDELSTSYSIFPNPAKDIVNIKSDNKIDKIGIISATGQLIFKQENCNNELIINTQGWQSGLYFIRFSTQNITITEKLIIK